MHTQSYFINKRNGTLLFMLIWALIEKKRYNMWTKGRREANMSKSCNTEAAFTG